MNQKFLKDLLKAAKGNPVISGFILLLLTGSGGASVGALATKSVVDEKHSIAMQRIDRVENEVKEGIDKFDEKLDRLDRKIDRVIFHVRGIR